MKKISTMLFVAFLGMFSLVGISTAEEASIDIKAIKVACATEAKGAIDVDEYIEDCVKNKEEELKEALKENANANEKG